MCKRFVRIIVAAAVISVIISLNNLFIKGDFYSYDLVEPAAGEVYYLDRHVPFQSPLYYISGRIFLPLKELVGGLGGAVAETEEGYHVAWKSLSYDFMKEDDEALSYPLHFEGNAPYISIYDVGQLFHMAVVFDSKANRISLYNREMPVLHLRGETQKGKAYLRLEDLSSDGAVNARANENLEKIRAMADYLYVNGHDFYVAWIPLYVNPQKNVVNDLTKNFNFYNADFLYTLDYIVHRNGHIVLHGYTHQYGDSISGEGVEFGSGCPFTPRQVERRFKEAKETAKILGYDDTLFNVPHYCITSEQLRIAEKYFDVIYQQSFYRKCIGKIDVVRRIGRTVLYVPTPIGYVTSLNELPKTLKKIDELPADQIVSMFLHPAVEYESIRCVTGHNGMRNFVYDENGIIPQLLRKISEKNLAFSAIEIEK